MGSCSSNHKTTNEHSLSSQLNNTYTMATNKQVTDRDISTKYQEIWNNTNAHIYLQIYNKDKLINMYFCTITNDIVNGITSFIHLVDSLFVHKKYDPTIKLLCNINSTSLELLNYNQVFDWDNEYVRHEFKNFCDKYCKHSVLYENESKTCDLFNVATITITVNNNVIAMIYPIMVDSLTKNIEIVIGCYEIGKNNCSDLKRYSLNDFVASTIVKN